ncbi:MAG TPA: PQQ-dependent sugar dehydrogenase [Mycobacteriales bacterium]|nr:PQQ-dependent sugar dehydrogenase [Mycobacteriales bacterium]
MRLRTLLFCSALAVAGVVVGPAVSEATTTATISPSNVRVSFHKVVGGLRSPVYVASARDGSHRLFVVEQGGTVRVVKSGVVQSTAYLNITSEVLSGGEQGFLSIAFHPGFTSHPFVFAAYTRSDGALQVSRFKASSASAKTLARSTEVKLFAVAHPNQTNHNGGQLMFGRSGYLFITTGDGGGAGDPYGNAERLTSLSGKVLRIDVDHSCGGRHYCIPSTNPFPRAKSFNKRLVFDWGLRNPWRASIDRSDGSLWIGDVGQDRWEEVDHVGAHGGIDFGWSCREGLATYNSSRCPGRTMRNPVSVYDHSNNREAVIGGFAYHGPSYPFAHGLYVFADYASGETWALGRTSAGGYPRALVATFRGNLAGFGEADGGEMYAVDLGGSLWHVLFIRR